MANEKKTKQPVKHVRAAFVADTFDEEARTVEVVFATDTPVLMRTWDGPFYEVLSFEPSHVRLDRLNAGGPLLDQHNTYGGVTEQLGVVDKAWVVGNKEGRAIVRFSKRADVEGVFTDVRDGIIKNVSILYRVYKYQEEPRAEGQEIPTYRAIDWEPMEVSFVTVPADYNAGVRADAPENNDIEIEFLPNTNTNQNRQKMTPEEIKKLEEAAAQRALDSVKDQILSPEKLAEMRTAAVDGERMRAKGIADAARAAKLTDEFANNLINNGTSIDEARKLIIEEFAKNDPNKGQRGDFQIIRDETETERSAIEVALLKRAAPSLVVAPGATASEKEKAAHAGADNFRSYTLLDFCRHFLIAKGEQTGRYSKNEIVARAMATGDFPLLLANVANKTLRRAYGAAPQTWRALASQMDAPDFKEMSEIQVGGKTQLLKVVEGGEFKTGKMTEGKETFSLATYGRIMSISRQAIINDDLGGFTRMSELIGRAVADLESDTVWALLTANSGGGVKMGDNKNLFHADHGNLAASGTAMDLTSLSAARLALRKQTGLDGEKLNLTPTYLIVTPEKQTLAEQLMSSAYNPTTQTNNNVLAGKFGIIVEDRLSDIAETNWLMAADPAQIDMLRFGYLSGEGLYTETRNGFEVDGMEMKVRLDFGASARDYRGFYRNPGA